MKSSDNMLLEDIKSDNHELDNNNNNNNNSNSINNSSHENDINTNIDNDNDDGIDNIDNNNNDDYDNDYDNDDGIDNIDNNNNDYDNDYDNDGIENNNMQRQSTLLKAETFKNAIEDTNVANNNNNVLSIRKEENINLSASPITAVLLWMNINTDNNDRVLGVKPVKKRIKVNSLDVSISDSISVTVTDDESVYSDDDDTLHHESSNNNEELLNIHRSLYRYCGRGKVKGVLGVALYQILLMISMIAIIIWFTGHSIGICEDNTKDVRWNYGSWYTGLLLTIGQRLLWGSDDSIKSMFDTFDGYMSAAAAASTLQIIDLLILDRPICDYMFGDNSGELLQLIWLGICILGWYSAWDSQLRWIEGILLLLFETVSCVIILYIIGTYYMIGSQSDVKMAMLLNPVGLCSWLINKCIRSYTTILASPEQSPSTFYGTYCLTCWPCCLCIPCLYMNMELEPFVKWFYKHSLKVTFCIIFITSFILCFIFNVGGFGGIGIGLLLAGLGMLKNSTSIDRLLWIIWWCYLLYFHTSHLKDILARDGLKDASEGGYLFLLVIYMIGCDWRRELLAKPYYWFEPIGFTFAYLKHRTMSVSLADFQIVDALKEAFEQKNNDLLQSLLKISSVFDVANARILPEAYMFISLETLKVLTNIPKFKINEYKYKNDNTALHYVYKFNYSEQIVKYLINECEMDPKTPNTLGNTALHIAAMSESHPMHSVVELENALKYLIEECKMNPNIQNKEGKTILHLLRSQCSRKFLKYLINECNADPYIQDKKGVNIIQFYIRRWNFGRNAHMLKWLINECNVDPSFIDTKGNTLLFHAIGCRDAINYLINDCRVDVNVKNNDGKTVLHYLALNANVDMLTYIIEAFKSDPHVTTENGATILHCAVGKEASPDLISYIIEEYEIDPNCTDNDGATPLHYGVGTDWDYDINKIRWLIDTCKMNPRVQDKNGTTILHLAIFNICMNSDKEILIYLINECKVDFNAKDADGLTILHMAVQHDDSSEIVKYLINECKMDPNSQDNSGKNCLHYAVQVGWHTDGNKRIIEYLVNECKMNPTIKENEGKTILHHAARNEDALVYVINEYHIDPNIQDNQGKTILHYIADNKVEYSTITLIEALFINDLKVDSNIKDNDGKTALHYAASKDNKFYADYLINQGKADTSIKDNNDNTYKDLFPSSSSS